MRIKGAESGGEAEVCVVLVGAGGGGRDWGPAGGGSRILISLLAASKLPSQNEQTPPLCIRVTSLLAFLHTYPRIILPFHIASAIPNALHHPHPSRPDPQAPK